MKREVLDRIYNSRKNLLVTGDMAVGKTTNVLFPLVDDVINKFEAAGYKVLTPKDKIKPVGQSKSYNKAKVMIENKFGQVFIINYNNFSNRFQYYKQLNSEDGYSAEGMRKKSYYEKIVAEFLNEQNIPYKREFKFTDCKKDIITSGLYELTYLTIRKILVFGGNNDSTNS